jgi:hypothetical protein
MQRNWSAGFGASPDDNENYAYAMALAHFSRRTEFHAANFKVAESQAG